MKVVAFLQLWNELERGNLRRCLDNCKQWADEIVIYDDASTDGSQDVYLEYTDKDLIIFGEKNEFNNELYHKQKLLDLTLTLNPDWIGWMDGDAIFEKRVLDNTESFLNDAEFMGFDSIEFHNVNLWKSDTWYRLDNSWNACKPVAFWKNNGNLHYNASSGLHQQMYPRGLANTLKTDLKILHYGFSSSEKIYEKYLRYKSYGQSGWALNRIIDEQSSYELTKAPREWYPDDVWSADLENEEMPPPEKYGE